MLEGYVDQTEAQSYIVSTKYYDAIVNGDIEVRISSITTESDFLKDLMSDEKMYDDNGKVTKYGTATYGLHGVNYNVYMTQADQYRKEIDSLRKQLIAYSGDDSEEGSVKKQQTENKLKEAEENLEESLYAINGIKIAIQNAITASNQKATSNINSINQQQTQQTTVKNPTTSIKPPTTTTKPPQSNSGGDGVPRIGDKVTYVSGN